MPVPIDSSFLFATAITLFAGVVRGFAGFGSSMLLAPSLSALYSPAIAIPMLAVMEAGVAVQLLPRAIPATRWRTVGPLALAALCAVPVGAYALRAIPAETMRWIISGAILVAITLIALGAGRKGEARLPGTLATGALSGLSSGATGMGGPPIVLYYLAGRDPASEIRGSLICFFVATSLSQLAVYALTGLLTLANGLQGLLMLPAFMLGALAGSRLFGQAHERTYRRVAFLLVVLVALASLPL